MSGYVKVWVWLSCVHCLWVYWDPRWIGVSLSWPQGHHLLFPQLLGPTCLLGGALILSFLCHLYRCLQRSQGIPSKLTAGFLCLLFLRCPTSGELVTYPRHRANVLRGSHFCPLPRPWSARKGRGILMGLLGVTVCLQCVSMGMGKLSCDGRSP